MLLFVGNGVENKSYGTSSARNCNYSLLDAMVTLVPTPTMEMESAGSRIVAANMKEGIIGIAHCSFSSFSKVQGKAMAQCVCVFF